MKVESDNGGAYKSISWLGMVKRNQKQKRFLVLRWVSNNVVPKYKPKWMEGHFLYCLSFPFVALPCLHWNRFFIKCGSMNET